MAECCTRSCWTGILFQAALIGEICFWELSCTYYCYYTCAENLFEMYNLDEHRDELCDGALLKVLLWTSCRNRFKVWLYVSLHWKQPLCVIFKTAFSLRFARLFRNYRQILRWISKKSNVFPLSSVAEGLPRSLFPLNKELVVYLIILLCRSQWIISIPTHPWLETTNLRDWLIHIIPDIIKK